VHLGDLLRIARDLGADARLVANPMETAPARGFEKDASARPERRAIELFLFVRVGPGEVGGGGYPVVDHALPLVAEHVDACAAALFFARKGRAVGLMQEWKRSHSPASLPLLRRIRAARSNGIALASRKRWR
jgi:hypothetical protein